MPIFILKLAVLIIIVICEIFLPQIGILIMLINSQVSIITLTSNYWDSEIYDSNSHKDTLQPNFNHKQYIMKL